MHEDYILDALEMVWPGIFPMRIWPMPSTTRPDLWPACTPMRSISDCSPTDTSIRSLPATLPSSPPNNTDLYASAQQQRTSLVREN